MKLNNIWSYGQLFGFSALDGPNNYYHDFVAVTMEEPLCFRFELDSWIKLHFPVAGNIRFEAVMGDFVEAQTQQGPFCIAFADANTLVGFSPALPEFSGELEAQSSQAKGVMLWRFGSHYLGLAYAKAAGGYHFAIHHSLTAEESRSCASFALYTDPWRLLDQRRGYYASLPPCKDSSYERLYYKAMSINKVNIRHPEGNIPCLWTTPDRIPHRHMWLWDSVFHAMALATYNTAAAESAILAVLSQQRSDGFIAHMMTPTGCSDLTQPPILSFGVYQVFRKSRNTDFLRKAAGALESYLSWDLTNRDRNGNGLLEWLTEPENVLCKCGESGWDDSPRFDVDRAMDCADFSVFFANDCTYLSKIFRLLGEEARSQAWQQLADRTKEQINTLLWDAENGAYYDRLFTGDFSRVLTPASLLPMFAGVPDEKQAKCLVEKLTDRQLLWSKNPLCSVSQSHPGFSNAMWRGGVWLNLNYFVMVGLHKYGYHAIAEKLQQKTLEMVDKWYHKTGSIFEFYDPSDAVAPYLCDRKGKNPAPPDWRRHMHAIADYNWSASFTILFIQNDLYLEE